MVFSVALVFCWGIGAFVLWALLDWLRDIGKPTFFNWPVVGDMIILARKLPVIHDYSSASFDLMSEARGKKVLTIFFKRPIMGQRGWNTIDRANVEHILKTNYANYQLAPLRQEVMGDFIGHGIFGSDGELWKLQRKTASYEFSNNRFREFMFEEFKGHSQWVMRVLGDACKGGSEVDMKDLFAKFSLSCICKIAFGVEVWDPYNETEGQTIDLDTKQFAHQWNSVTKRVIKRMLDPLTNLLRFLNLGPEAEMKRNLDGIDSFLNKLIDIRLGLPEEELVSKCDLLSRYLQIGEECSSPDYPHRKFVRDMVISFVLAGRDTTGTLLAWTLSKLTFHRDVEEKIIQEIRTVIPEGVPMEYDSIRTELNYLHATLFEVLRLYPPVPYDPKTALKADTLPDGTPIHAGDQVGFSPYTMGRRAEYWEDPMEFRPERFLDGDGKFVRPDPFVFTAFQAGPRICLGMEMALIEVKTLLALLLPKYRLEFPPETQGRMPDYDWDLTLTIKDQLMMKVSQR